MEAGGGPAPQLRSFQHCRKDVDIVCFRLPGRCPLCGEDTAETPCRIPPYVMPSPFVSSAEARRCVVLRPTHGDFLGHYNGLCDLHIGLTDSLGRVAEFDERGLTVGSVWPQCLVVLTCPPAPPLPRLTPPTSLQDGAELPSYPQPEAYPTFRHTHSSSGGWMASETRHSSGVCPAQQQHQQQQTTPHAGRVGGDDGTWDAALVELTSGPGWQMWESSRYNEQVWNCFDLVLRFLSILGGSDLDIQLGLDPSPGSGDTRRAQFCDLFLTRKCRRAEQYVHLYRHVQRDGFVCVPRSKQTSSEPL